MTAIFHAVNINKETAKPEANKKTNKFDLEKAVIRVDAISNILQTVFEAFSNEQPLISPELDNLFDQVSYLQMELHKSTTDLRATMEDYFEGLKN